MGISVENFMASQTETGRQSKLDPFTVDILLLKKNGFSQKQIQQFLAQNGIHAGLTTINWFIRSRSKKTIVPDPVQPISPEKPKPAIAPAKQETPPSNTEAGKARTFDWQNQPTREELFGTPTNEPDK
jgi:hypothetical protein